MDITYAKVEGEAFVAFDLTIAQVRHDNPRVVIFDPPGDLTHIGYFEITPTEPPAVNRWQGIRGAEPKWIGGELMQQFEIYDLPVTLAEKREAIKRDADLLARIKRDAIVAGISPGEMASWSIKRAEGLVYKASGSAVDAPNLQLEAQARGLTLAALVGKVLTKASGLAALEAAIAGRCGAIQDAAAVATNEAELLAIDLQSGWPV